MLRLRDLTAAYSDPFFAAVAEEKRKRPGASVAQLATDEDFWRPVQAQFAAHPTILNLNNGSVCPQPLGVQQAFIDLYRLFNTAPAYYMWKQLDDERERIRGRLAALGGCAPAEIAFVRNTSEGMNFLIHGLELKPGDEVVLSPQDYPSVINAWKVRERREGIVLKWVELPLPSTDAEALAAFYLEQFTPRTRAVNLTHIINWTGQLMPVKRIADEARKRGIFTMTDIAHSFAHLDFKIPDLGCDAAATSLHKWLCAPFGTGLMYVRKDAVPQIWPRMPHVEFGENVTDLRKLEGQNTRNLPAELAIDVALDVHEAVTTPLLQARLYYLKEYWTQKAAALPGVRILTPADPAWSSGLALMDVDGRPAPELAEALLQQHNILTMPTDWGGIKGLRITPHLYTTLPQLDRFIAALASVVQV